MFKKLLAVSLLVATTFVTVAPANAQVAVEYTYFCHRSNSAANPYQVKPFSTGYSEIDGEGNNDHTQHTGPVPTTVAEAQALKSAGTDWGDIIPPVAGVLPSGLNWTAEGQAIYANGCNLVDEQPAPEISWEVTCIVRDNTDYVQVVLANEGDVEGTVTVNGTEVTVPAAGSTSRVFADGTRVVIVVGEETVYDQVAQCAEPSDPETPQVLGTSTPTKTTPTALPNTGSAAVVSLMALASGVALIGAISKVVYTKYL